MSKRRTNDYECYSGTHSSMLVQSFAGGVLLTLLADTMMPEAFRYRGKQVGPVTTLGFALAFFITTIWLCYGPTLSRLRAWIEARRRLAAKPNILKSFSLTSVLPRFPQ